MKTTVYRNSFYVALALIVSLVIWASSKAHSDETKIKELNSTNETLVTALIAKQEQLLVIGDQINGLTNQLEMLNSEQDNMKKQIETLEATNLEKTSENEKLQQDNEKLRKEVDAAKKQQVANEQKEKAEKVAKTPSRSNSNVGGDWKVFMATAYTAKCAGCSGVTATGINVKNQSKDHRVIAVDPSVIPLGSLVEVDGYGKFIAGDTGGAIKGHKIDVLVQSTPKALDFGKKKVQVRVLRSGY